VTVKLITTREKPREVFSGVTDANGRVEVSFEIPELPGANAAVICQAQAVGNNAELKQLVLKPGVASPSGS
jgi:hypothetical protein